ncbi:carboxylesterase/lipase family protein [Granulicella sp. S156]|uniref:carboxylesterase/lipase family protein n=1 Tax=Granulicella sp. S156 TaxID=1747224 RepID=UPI00131BB08E|nr:carboxylesterase family protein [Granulicella sp. S156]
MVLVLSSLSAFAQNRTVRTESGLVQGIPANDAKISAFLGIPYAAPPLGDLRWREPQSVPAWSGIRKADHFSASCIQHISGERLPWTREFLAQLPISEDCLYLNVWTPEIKTKEPKAVLLWIHGGGFVEGAASPAMYNGEQLARMGIVVVSINYRLGIMGFFAHPELTQESAHHASGNYGLLDIVAALQWTQKNIRAFGGDPARVTIAGQSAGGTAEELLTASPLAKGLFRAAIIESGATLSDPTGGSLAEAEQQGTQFAVSIKKPTLKELRGLSAEDLQTLERNAHLRFGADVDGWFLSEGVPAVFAAGRQNDVVTIDGMVADEGSSSKSYGALTPEEFQKQVRKTYQSLADEFLSLYPSSTQAECTESQKQLERDRRLVSMYLWGVKRAGTSKTSFYTYYFDHALPWPEHPEFGAFHSAEIPYWTRNLKALDRPYTPVDWAISDTLSSYWANFVKTGNPNGKGLPAWPALEPAEPVTMELGDRVAPQPVVSPEKFKLWMEYQKVNPQLE